MVESRKIAGKFEKLRFEILKAKLRMNSTFVSATDTGGFHLTIFSAYEFLSQLAIIYGHIGNGLTEKNIRTLDERK